MQILHKASPEADTGDEMVWVNLLEGIKKG